MCFQQSLTTAGLRLQATPKRLKATDIGPWYGVYISYGYCYTKWGARGLASRAESNRAVVNPNLHDWCFRLAWQAPSLYGASEGSASEAADVAARERIEGAMHQSCSFKRIQPLSVPQVYCIAAERRFRAACQPPAGSAPPSRCRLTGRWAFRGEPQGRTFFNTLKG